MALASVSQRMSAQIILLPGAASVPVINSKLGVGRPPKNVISIQQAHRIRRRQLEQRESQRAVAPSIQFFPVPPSSSPWPFTRACRADFDLLDEADRWFLENTIALTISKYRKGAN